MQVLYRQITCPNGDQKWYFHGKEHRVDGPAVVRANGDQFWYFQGKIHREDGPAIVKANGDQEWFLENKRHRENGPAFIKTNGDQEWFLYDNNVPKWKVTFSKNCKSQIDTCPVCHKQTNCIQFASCNHGICKGCFTFFYRENCCICNAEISLE